MTSVASNSNKHPKVSEMVLLSITILNERNGSSVQAIKKYIAKNFNVEQKKISAHIKKYLRMAVASGTLVQTKGKGALGSFRLGGSMKFKMTELLAKVPQQMTRDDSTSKKTDKKGKSNG